MQTANSCWHNFQDCTQKWVMPDPQSMPKARRVDAATLTKLLGVKHILQEFLPDYQKRVAEAGESAAFLLLQWFCSPVVPSFEITSSERSGDEQLQLFYLEIGTGCYLQQTQL